MITINSDSKIKIDKPFKVFAGPGAGKTYWLINHIQNVLHNSNKLSSTSKIACITYTNAAVDEIQKRLENNGDRVYVSTIHNFLYKFIVKPFAFLLKDANNDTIINLKILEGHDEHIPNNRIIYDWKKENRLFYLNDDDKLYKCLVDLDWSFNKEKELILNPRNIWRKKVGAYSVKSEYFYSYKKYYWNIGQIHHEDVLFFSYKLLFEHQKIIDYISWKFPYIFIDEFQDTNPIQTKIIKKISDRGSIVGVIGDSEQSIYKFQGAERKDFIDFNLPNLETYQINGNRRSTNAIVKILDNLRTDKIKQTPIRNVAGITPIFLIGKLFDVVHNLQKMYPDIITLSRTNETVCKIKYFNNKKLGNLWEKLRSLDNNYERQQLLYNTIYASEMCLLGNYREALRIASKLFRYNSFGIKFNKAKKKELAISLIDLIVSQREINKNKSIFEFNNDLYKYMSDNYHTKIGAKIIKSEFGDFSKQYTYTDLTQSLRINEDTSAIRTIHKAKGAEFNNVLVVFDSEDELKYILEPYKYQNSDDSRIYYVAFSRARNSLFLCIDDEVDGKILTKLDKIGIKSKLLEKK